MQEQIKPSTAVKEVVIVEGKLRKIIHQEGEGDLPAKGNEIYALYRGTLQNGEQFDSNQDRENPFNFTLGQGSVIKGWDQGFATMKAGEKATLICSPEYAYGARGSPPRIPPNSTLHFEVELLSFKEKQKEKWELSSEEKIAKANECKAKGNELLKKGEFKAAISEYKEGIEYVESQIEQESKSILTALRLNISQAYLKVSNYGQVIKQSSKVLEHAADNVKALYRRGIAYLKSQDFQKSKNDFKELLKFEPDNVEAKKELANIAAAIKQFKEKEKKVFGSLFSKGGLYEDKKIEKPKETKPEQIESEEDDAPEPEEKAPNIQPIVTPVSNSEAPVESTEPQQTEATQQAKKVQEPIKSQ